MPSGKGLGHRSCRKKKCHTNFFHLMLLRFNGTSIIVCFKKRKTNYSKNYSSCANQKFSGHTHIKVERDSDNVIPELEYVHPLCQEFGETMCLEHQNY